jgi:hypothetical protein
MAAAMTFALAGCVNESYEGGSGVEPVSTAATFTVEMPASHDVATRASAAESSVERLWIVLCNADGVYERTVRARVGGVTIDNTSGVASLTASAAIEFRAAAYDLLFVANLPDTSVLNTLMAGDDRDDIQSKLLMTRSAGENWSVADGTDKIPMYGELHEVELYKGVTPATVTLRRALARVDVRVSAANFRLRQIRVYNYNTRGELVPDSVSAVTPSLPGNTGRQTTALLYDPTAEVPAEEYYNQTQYADRIYLFENAHVAKYGEIGWKDNPCLVVTGWYDADVDGRFDDEGEATHYRLDFTTAAGRGAWLDVVRNHSYNFEITSIAGKGYNTPDAARNAPPTNIAADILVWDEADIAGHDIYNGTRYTVTATNATGGTAVANYPYALEGMEVDIAATGNPGFRLERWTIYDSADNDITASLLGTGGETANPATFTMPATNIRVVSSFRTAPFFSILMMPTFDYQGNGIGWGHSYTNTGFEAGETTTLYVDVASGHLDYGDFAGWRLIRSNDGTDVTDQLLADPTDNYPSFVMPDYDLTAIMVFPVKPVNVEIEYVVIESDNTVTPLGTPAAVLTPQDNAAEGATAEIGANALPGGTGGLPGQYVSYRVENIDTEYEFAGVYNCDDGTIDLSAERELSADANDVTFQLLPRADVNGEIKGGRTIAVALRRRTQP